MKSKFQNLMLLFISVTLFTISCKKETGMSQQDKEALSALNAKAKPGHLKQTNTFTSDVVKQWLDVQTQMLFNPQGKVPTASYGIGAGRLMAYSGVALYEAVVPGMPAYQSLSGQLRQMPDMPETTPGYAYHWPTCANAALAQISRRLFGVFYNPTTGDALETSLNNLYQEQISDPAVFERSVAFGKEVANKIADWAGTDRPWLDYKPLKLNYPAPIGDWRPEDNALTVAPGLAYWGETLNIVPGSTENVASPKMEYSTDNGSEYFENMEEVFEVSKNLTFEQRLQAFYYDDPASLLPAGAHYWAILKQVTEQLNPKLDIAALAYAKSGMTLFDATIGSIYAKFEMMTERPFHFIRRETDLNWEPLLKTPSHPDHPSNHAVFSSSFAYALTSIFGENVHFSNNVYDGIQKDLKGGFGVHNLGTRNYSSFYDMMNDISYSRLYGGIHTRYACEEGIKQGIKTATNVHNKVRFLK